MPIKTRRIFGGTPVGVLSRIPKRISPTFFQWIFQIILGGIPGEILVETLKGIPCEILEGIFEVIQAVIHDDGMPASILERILSRFLSNPSGDPWKNPGRFPLRNFGRNIWMNPESNLDKKLSRNPWKNHIISEEMTEVIPRGITEKTIPGLISGQELRHVYPKVSH